MSQAENMFKFLSFIHVMLSYVRQLPSSVSGLLYPITGIKCIITIIHYEEQLCTTMNVCGLHHF